MRDHRNLKAWELSDSLVTKVYAFTAEFPRHEIYGMRSQIRRAALSVPTNIVEGVAYQSQAQFIRFLEMAFGSIRELEYLITIAQRLHYLELNRSEELLKDTVEASRVLYGLIQSHRK